MLIVTYDPNCGEAIRDGEVEGRVERDIADSSYNTLSIVVASEIYINYLRIAVKQKRIAKEDVKIFFESEELELTNGGRILRWPSGFCDAYGLSLEMLLS